MSNALSWITTRTDVHKKKIAAYKKITIYKKKSHSYCKRQTDLSATKWKLFTFPDKRMKLFGIVGLTLKWFWIALNQCCQWVFVTIAWIQYIAMAHHACIESKWIIGKQKWNSNHMNIINFTFNFIALIEFMHNFQFDSWLIYMEK